METTLPSSSGHPVLGDPARLRALRESHLLAGEPVASFERLVRLGSALACAPVCLVSLVDDTRQVFAGATGLTGELAETRQTLLSHSFCQYVVGDGAPLVVGDARDHPVLRHNGGVRDHGVVAYAGFPLRDPDGHVLGTFCAADTVARTWDEAQLAALADLAATAELEIALRLRERVAHLSAQRLELVLEASDLAVVATDLDDRVTSLSPGARALLGTGGPTEPGAEATGASLFGRPLPMGRTDVDLPGPHGTTHLSVARRPLRDQQGDPVGSVIVATDMTEARVYQGALAAALEEEVRANAARRQLTEQQAAFIATASHELRTPVTNILGYTEVLLDDLDEDAAPGRLVRALAPVRRNAERLADLVEHVADFVRLDTSRTPTTMATQVLADVVEAAAATVVARHPAARLRIDVPPRARVVGDRDLLERMLVHLLDNAATFSPPDASVTLRGEAALASEGTDPDWLLEVADEGPGLAPEEVALVTRPFFRGRAAHAAASPGVGLGLAVVAAICELHGATLSLSSGNRGTRASVRLRGAAGDDDGTGLSDTLTRPCTDEPLDPRPPAGVA